MTFFIKEFRDFIRRKNVVDLAVAVVIGAAFGKIVGSFVDDLIMPPIGYLLSGMDFTHLGITLKEATESTPAVVIRYGNFISTLLDFVIISFAIFLVIRLMARISPKKEPDSTQKKCLECAMNVPKEARLCCYCTSPFK